MTSNSERGSFFRRPRRHFLCSIAGLIVLCLAGAAWAGDAANRPVQNGLVLWLDASVQTSVKTDARGHVVAWEDLSGSNHSLAASETEATQPTYVAAGMNNAAVVRFSGAQFLRAKSTTRESAGPLTMIVVSQRSGAQACESKWQRLFTSTSDPERPDDKDPNFCMTADSNGSGAAFEATIFHGERSSAPIGTITLGQGSEGTNGFCGDIAEVLVYDRGFLSEGELRVVLDYLHQKWNARILTKGWTLTGPLGAMPLRTRDDLPLSDQANQGTWELDKSFSDEFDAPSLDTRRWHDHEEQWLGREPAFFSTKNVSVEDGMLRLAFRKENLPEMKEHKGYKDYTSAYVRSTRRTGYGYYEIEARMMESAASSAFWFWNPGLKDHETELDVFEVGAKGKGFERKYNMNAHVFKSPKSSDHWAVGGVWQAPWNLGEAYHVYGFEWSEKKLIWYVDGVPVRRADNTDWFYPMWLVFDSEAFWGWFGKVDDADLPSFFNIKYVRVWRQRE